MQSEVFMSTVCWAGLGIDPQTQDPETVEGLNSRIDNMIAGSGEEPHVRIEEADGSRMNRYRFGAAELTEVFDRSGQRIGFGIEACSEEDGWDKLVDAHKILLNWGILDISSWVSVWAWDRMAIPAKGPVDIVFDSLGE